MTEFIETRKEIMENTIKRMWKVALAIALTICFTAPGTFAGTVPPVDLFKAKCAACHGPDGSANTTMGKVLKIRDLGSADVQKQSDEELLRITAKGKGKMPAFEGKLKAEQLGEVVGYIRAFGKKN